VEIPFGTQDIPVESGIENMVRIWGDSNFFGFNPGILDMKIPYANIIPIPQMLLRRGWLLFPILSAIFATRQAGKSIAARFLLSCFLLGFLTWFPITGWIFGYFLSAWMLERAVWLFPFGLSTIYTFLVIREFIEARKPFKIITRTVTSISPDWLLLMITIFAIGMFSLYLSENGLPDIEKFSRKSQRYQGFAIAGQELDRQISGFAYVIGSQQLNDLIPGISAKSKLITYRISNPANMQYFTTAQIDERISDTRGVFSKTLPPKDKMLLIEKYDIRFLFLQSIDLILFNDLISNYPDRIKVTEIGGVILLHIYD
jgi:hypothetical protein